MKNSDKTTLKDNLIKKYLEPSSKVIHWIINWQGFTTLIMMGIWFLLPLKYGGNVNPTETAMWKPDLFSWVIAPWPVFTFPFLSALGLLLVLVNRRGFSKNSLYYCLMIVLPALMVLIASLIGWINTTEKDVAYLFSAQQLGIVVLVSASLIHIQAYPKARRLILISICAGALAASAMTWHHKYNVYPKVLQSLETKSEQGKQVDQNILSKLRSDTNFSGPFSWKNTLGAHLILLFPVCVLLAWKAGSNLDPPIASSFVITGSVLICILGALWFSRSLASTLIITTMLTCIVLFWIIRKYYRRGKPYIHRLKYIFLLLLITIILGTFFKDWIDSENKLSSLNARFMYWEQAIQMFKEKPLVGVGMGEYYTHYLQQKAAETSVTKFPHSLFLFLLSQCGIFGGLAAFIMLFYPIWLLILVIKQKLVMQSETLWVAVFCGSIAWVAHSLVDFNIQVPATVSTFLILPSLGLKFHKDNIILPVKRFIPIGLVGGLLVGLCLFPISRIAGENNYMILNQLIKNDSSEEQIYAIGENASQGLPHSPYPPSIIAQVALHSHQYEYALEQLKESIRRAPHRSIYYALLAQTYEKMGRPEDALASIEQALFWFPTNEDYKKIKLYLIDSN